MRKFILKNFKLRLNAISEAGNPDLKLKSYVAAALKLSEHQILELNIRGKSTDARKKGEPFFIYTLILGLEDTAEPPADCEIYTPEVEPARPAYKRSAMPQHPLVIGTGPAGLLTALTLARAGCNPIIIDRGFDVDKRGADVEQFFSSRALNTESNFLYGEGGAGTYSDGKLYTRKNAPGIDDVLKIFVNAGAPPEILYLNRPHIGSDLLPHMVKNIRKETEALGGKYLWGKQVSGVSIKDGQCRGVILADGERLDAPAVFLGFGLSARELIKNLIASGVEYDFKGFQLGVRIEHPQDMIDVNQYGMETIPPFLGAAEYNFVSRPQDKNMPGVSTFCMCPGGEIVPATALEHHLSTNGMSPYRRDQQFANSCLISTFHAGELAPPDKTFAYIEALERKAFELGGGDYTAPAQDAEAFLRGENGLKHKSGSYRFGMTPARLDELLPAVSVKALKAALKHFDRQCRGFIKHGKLVGIETHISSPVRFIRDPQTLESSLQRLYITGEGAGCAGGIMSAALDGMKTAEAYLNSFNG